MKQSNNVYLFIGYKFPYGNPKFGKNLDVYIFVDALSKVIGKKVKTYYLKGKKNESKDIIDFCQKIKPNFIFFNLINDEIGIDCLLKLKSLYTTINWFGDDQWRFESFSSKISKYFTYSITTDKFSIEKYKKIGINVIYSQWGAIDHNKSELDFKNLEYKYDVTFVGGYSYTREWLIEYLRNNDINVKVFGNGWNKEQSFLDYNEISNIFYLSKVNLNLSNSVPKDLDFIKFFVRKFLKNITSFKNFKLLLKAIKFFFFYKKSTEQIKARNFEIPIAGGFQISNYCISLEDFLEIGKEVVVFNTKEELLTQVRYFLANNIERNMIRNKAYIESRKNTYENRFRNFLNKITENI